MSCLISASNSGLRWISMTIILPRRFCFRYTLLPRTGPERTVTRLTRPAPSNKLKTFHFEPNLWQTAFMSSFLTGA